MRIPLLFLLVALVLSACIAPGQPTAPRLPVRGKVSLDGKGTGGVVVSVWPAETAALAGAAPQRSAPSADNGEFVLELPAGEYYFLAHGRGTFAYYGRNPVAVAGSGLSDLKIGLVAIPPPPVPERVEFESGVTGTVSVRGEARAGAVVFAYTDLTSRLKGMGYAMSAPTDEQGRFALPLPAGTYYLLARLRQAGAGVTGPLRAGDYIGYAAESPLRLRDKELRAISLPLLEVPEKVEQLTDSLFGGTSLKGRIITRDGRPVGGARAILYGEAQMLNRPLYVSRPTDADGHFVLSFPHGGTYFLAARQQLGGAPAAGELFGTYDATPDHSLTIATGEQREGIEVVVEEMW